MPEMGRRSRHGLFDLGREEGRVAGVGSMYEMRSAMPKRYQLVVRQEVKAEQRLLRAAISKPYTGSWSRAHPRPESSGIHVNNGRRKMGRVTSPFDVGSLPLGCDGCAKGCGQLSAVHDLHASPATCKNSSTLAVLSAKETLRLAPVIVYRPRRPTLASRDWSDFPSQPTARARGPQRLQTSLAYAMQQNKERAEGA